MFDVFIAFLDNNNAMLFGTTPAFKVTCLLPMTTGISAFL